MNARDRNGLIHELMKDMPPGWSLREVDGRTDPLGLLRAVPRIQGCPHGIYMVPPTGQARYGPVRPWPGPGRAPSGLSLVRVMATSQSIHRPRQRTVLCKGLPGDRKMRILGSGYEGRGWAQAMAQCMLGAARKMHAGEKPLSKDEQRQHGMKIARNRGPFGDLFGDWR